MTINANTQNNSQSPVGVIYAVTSPETQTTHFLIGTLHAVDLETLQNPCYKQTVEKCSLLFTEIGTNYHLHSNDGCLPGIQQHDVPFPYCLDAFLMMSAWCKKIPIKSLDENVPEMYELLGTVSAQRREMGVDFYDEVASATMRMDQTGIKSTEYTSQQVKSYKEGDFDYLNQLRQEVLSYSEKRERIIISGEKPTTITTYLDDFYQIPTYKETDGYKHRITRPKGEVLITKREEKWAEILVPQLLKTTQPICIAVGVAHVVGKDNLSDRFAKAGFKVELITPKHRSRL